MKKLPIVAIVGRTNAGKSSLFNRVVGMRRAVVTDQPGTTRDTVTQVVAHKDKSFWLADTAGMKSAEDEFESTIIEQISEATEVADAIIVVVDHTENINEDDRKVAKQALKSGKPVFLALNKTDKKSQFKLKDFQKLGIKQIFQVSAEHGRGIDELLDSVVTELPKRQAKAEDSIKIALIGRPNVGKSHLFNTLSKKQQAIVADVAGTTRDVNRNTVRYHDQAIELLDTAGIRRPGKIGKAGIEKFSVLRSLWAIEEADICLLVMDVNEYATKLDQKIAGMVKDGGKGLILIISKWDTAEEDPKLADKLLAQLRHDFDFVPWAPVILTSSVTGGNVAKILDLSLEIYQNRQLEIPTKELNDWLGRVVAQHEPAGLKNKHPKLKYITQTGTNPLELTIQGADLDFLHWSYKRYLERKLREDYQLDGTSLRLIFKK